MTGQKEFETHHSNAGLGRASGSSEPGARALAPTYSDGQPKRDTQSIVAVGEGPTTDRAQPSGQPSVPHTISHSDGQSRGDRQSTIAVGEGPASGRTNTRETPPVPHPFTDPGSDAGARAAIVATEPSQLAPRAQSSGASSGAGESEASGASLPKAVAPRSQTNTDGHGLCDTQVASAVGTEGSGSNAAPDPTHPNSTGQLRYDTHRDIAGRAGRAAPAPDPTNPDGQSERDTHLSPAVGEGEGGISAALDLRFSDPLVQEIVETWRLRQDFLRAHTRITLQIRAICRRLCGGDKAEADRVYASMLKDREHPLAETAWLATMPLVSAREPIEDGRKRLEKQLAKLAQRLPTAPFAATTRGFGFASLAATYGECGDVAAYRTVSGLWKRAGLAVIDGERQRKVAGDAALLHGYSPARRSVFWNIAALQVKTNGAYRPLYDARKQYRLDQGWPKGHAHNEAGRYITKRLLRDLWIAAREARS